MALAQGEVRTHAAPRWGLWLALILIALTALRILALFAARTDLFFDEAQYWTWSQNLAFGYYSKPPLLAWIIRAVTSLCGNSAPCVRLASPLFYAGTSVFLFFVAKALYDIRTAFWSAVIFATLPGVSFSSNLISTDVPLLFFWSASLYFGLRLLEDHRWRWAILCGLAIGLGALSKYAMLYFYLCAAVWFLIARDGRWLLRSARGAILILIPLVLLAPNLLWNLNNGLVTFTHTAANADIKGALDHPVNMLSFVFAQCGVFNPILFPMLLWIGLRAIMQARSVECPSQTKLLLAFSLPVLVLMTILAFLSRAHANWAATAFPAATVLTTAVLLQRQRKTLFAVTLGLNILAVIAMCVTPAIADRLVLPGNRVPFRRTLGWHAMAQAVAKELAAHPYGTVLTNDRGPNSELLYYLRRDKNLALMEWRQPGPPLDHYQLTRPFHAGAKEPILLVSLHPAPEKILQHFAVHGPIIKERISTGGQSGRNLFLQSLSGFKGAADER